MQTKQGRSVASPQHTAGFKLLNYLLFVRNILGYMLSKKNSSSRNPRLCSKKFNKPAFPPLCRLGCFSPLPVSVRPSEAGQAEPGQSIDVCSCVYVCFWVGVFAQECKFLQRPEEGVRALGAEVAVVMS